MEPFPDEPGRAAGAPAYAELRARYVSIRQATQALAAPLSAEDCTIQSMPDASPVKWHLAHTSWFFETFVLEPNASRYRPLDPAYRMLFNSYYHAVGDRHPRPDRGMLSRPGLKEILAYRRHVDDAVAALLANAVSAEIAALIELGLQHEQQHQELILTDVKHLLSLNPLNPPYRKQWPLTPVRAREPRWIAFAGGQQEIGHSGAGFCFDNETPRHRVWLDRFEIASHPVTHGDFIRFIDDGGYRRPELWLAAGWELVANRAWEAPQYWRRCNGEWRVFTLHGEEPVDPNTPVCHVSFFEAEAFARWANARLPRKASGKSRLARRPASVTSSRAARFIRSRSGKRRLRASSRRLSAMSGNGRAATTPRIPVTNRRRARSANTTASSWWANTCCAVDPA